MAFLIRTAVVAVLAVPTFLQLGTTPLAALVLMFLIAVVWAPFARQEVR
jgi:hypothetical protein